MRGRTIDAEEDPVRHGRPSRVLCITIETHLVFRLCFQFSEKGVLVRIPIRCHGSLAEGDGLRTQGVYECSNRTPPDGKRREI